MPLRLTDELELMRRRWTGPHPPQGKQAREDVMELFRVLDEAHVQLHNVRDVASAVGMFIHDIADAQNSAANLILRKLTEIGPIKDSGEYGFLLSLQEHARRSGVLPTPTAQKKEGPEVSPEASQPNRSDDRPPR